MFLVFLLQGDGKEDDSMVVISNKQMYIVTGKDKYSNQIFSLFWLVIKQKIDGYTSKKFSNIWITS